MTRFRNGTFSVRFTAKLTPDATVKGALFNLITCTGHSCPATGGAKGQGTRLWIDGKQVVDNWRNVNASTAVSQPVDLTKGKSMDIIVEYYQASTSGNPSVLLQWSLLSTTQGPNTDSADSIAKAAATASSSGAAVVVLGGANNDRSSTTEGEGIDRSALTLPGQQLSLLKAVVEACNKTAVPVVVVLVDGKPTAVSFRA